MEQRAHDDDLDAAAPAGKSRYSPRKTHLLRHRQPGAALLPRHPQDHILIDHQLHKALCLALYAAGFSSVTRDALNSFRDAVQEYMLHFSLRVHASMRSCRRSAPLPQDFIHALAQFDIAPSALLPELPISPPPAVAQAPILPSENSLSFSFDQETFIPRDELFLNDSVQTHHIPRHFPVLPSKHSYVATPVFASREHDALKIRERATNESSQAEQALRNLIAATKASENRRRQSNGQLRGQDHIEWDDIWQQALIAMGEEEQARTASEQDDISFGLDGSNDMAVSRDKAEADTRAAGFANYDRIFGRRAQKKRTMRAS